MTEGTVGGCPWASGHPTLLLAMSKVLRTGGKESSAFTPVSVPLNIPGHPLEGTSVLPSSPWCLGPPECPSAPPPVLPITPTVHSMAHPPQCTYRGPPRHWKSRNGQRRTPSQPLPLNPQTHPPAPCLFPSCHLYLWRRAPAPEASPASGGPSAT